ncbi:helix-turn-helix domain-containing protein [Flavobacterium sp. UBA7680]|uniref:helix-turn-helix domain-containing protein n=1 Tax=Flavobacterium sp. UBA7680 TaxID=1946559 RepID=UPI0025BD8B0E|nr:helix-turn-helix transcriptional regulator [Flavobacterium sp. UBA7680]
MNIGELIRKLRLTKDIKAVVIYEKLGISQSTYSKIENNKYKIDIKTLKEISSILSTDLTTLIGEEKEAKIDEIRKNDIEKDVNVFKLIKSLETQSELLREQNSFLKNEINNKNKEINQLKRKLAK